MPHKFNASCRHKIAKQKFKVMNCSAYNENLRQRGDLTVWVSDEALCLWSAARRTSRGGQPKYSDLAIMLCLSLRIVYRLPLRQTQGLMRSVAKLMGLDIAVPDFSTLSRRSKGLVLPSVRRQAASREPVHLVVDSTGLKVFGAGEWLENKHKTKAKRKSWRKLHLGLDLVSGEIICSDLTTDDVGDPTALPGLLDQISGSVTKFIADGAYDGAPSRDLLDTRFGANLEVIISPPKTAVLSPQAERTPSVRDRHIAQIQTCGRLAWQKATGYNQRSRGETQMGRWKTVIGPKLKARDFDNQKTEANIGVRILNQMTELGRPQFQRVT
ncbi:IS5 family transposase [Brucella pituitosa]|uniref:IS5 family transposase n=1 Tax=Brucella pituitosa TaxID=571256 RepID=UPI0009A14A1D|nr:IS5 family transposase [Brucella pituitosa]